MKTKSDKQRGALFLSVISVIGFNFIDMEVATAQDGDEPSEELLEFLSEWETKDGEWLDPFTFLVNDENALLENTQLNSDRVDGNDSGYVKHEESNYE